MAYNSDNVVTLGQVKRLAQRMNSEIGSIDVSGNLSHETFTFELEDGTTVDKEIVLWTSQA